MATVTQQSIVNTIEQLHKDTSDNTGAIDETGGLYTLINNMISNLSSIKASIKTEEKKMVTDLGAVTTVAGATAIGVSATVNAASLAANATATRGDVHVSNAANIANNVAVYSGSVTTATKYSEGAAWECLKAAAQTIVDFKEGTVTGSDDAVTQTNAVVVTLQADT